MTSDDPAGSTPGVEEHDPRSAALGSATPVTLGLTTALAGAAFGCTLLGIPFDRPLTLALLVAIAWVAETFASLVQRFSSMSLTSTLVAVAAVLCGPVAAAIVGFVAAGFAFGRLSVRVRAFNAAMTGWLGMVGGLVFRQLTVSSGDRQVWLTEHIETLIIPMAVMTLAMMLANALMLSLVIAVTTRVPYSRSLRDFGEHSAVLFLIGGLISYLMVVLWVGAGTGPLTVLVMAPPLLLAQWAYSSIAAEASTVDNAVAALGAALELNRPGSRRHGELVMVIAEEIGNLRGLAGAEMQDVRHAARLHHLGTIDRGTERARWIDRDCARRGADLLDGIASLRNVRTIVAAQADPAGSASSTPAVGVLRTADALASSIEQRIIDGGGQGLDTQGLRDCLDSVAERDDLDVSARESMRAAGGGALLGRITLKLGDLYSAESQDGAATMDSAVQA